MFVILHFHMEYLKSSSRYKHLELGVDMVLDKEEE